MVVYNTDQLSPDELPDSILDFAKPEWAGRISYSPTGADFQAIVSAVLELEGEDATRTWLQGLDNGTVYDGNNVVLESVNAGEVEAEIIYHYYWYRDQKESGRTATAPSCTSSATRTRAPSSASRAPACSPPASTRRTPRRS